MKDYIEIDGKQVQLLNLCPRVALKALLELLKLPHHILKLPHHSWHFPAAEYIKQWVHCLPPSLFSQALRS